MQNPLISVIIPIYNVEKYLQQCLDSVAKQSYSHLEVILVDDGSTDSSQEIAKAYLNDPRFSLITKENGGLSSARNAGLDVAKGEYIYFVDSDDYIHQDFLKEMIELMLQYKVEFVCSDCVVWFDENGVLREPKKKAPELLSVDSKSIVIGGAVWRCLFAKALIERAKVRFLEGKIYEDEAFLYMVLPFCKQFVRFCGKPYYYRQRHDSIMGQYKKFRSYDLLDVFETIYLFYKEKGFLEKIHPPYYFLYHCVGYSNEKEYLQKAKDLSQRLGISFSPPPPIKPYPLKMQKFLQKDMEEFLRWNRKRFTMSKLKDFIKRRIEIARRRLKLS